MGGPGRAASGKPSGQPSTSGCAELDAPYAPANERAFERARGWPTSLRGRLCRPVTAKVHGEHVVSSWHQISWWFKAVRCIGVDAGSTPRATPTASDFAWCSLKRHERLLLSLLLLLLFLLSSPARSPRHCCRARPRRRLWRRPERKPPLLRHGWPPPPTPPPRLRPRRLSWPPRKKSLKLRESRPWDGRKRRSRRGGPWQRR